MSNTTVIPEAKLRANVRIGKLVTLSIFRHTKDQTVWNCRCDKCKQQVQMSEDDLLGNLYKACVHCTIKDPMFRHGKKEWSKAVELVKAGKATMDPHWCLYTSMVRVLGLPTKGESLQVETKDDGSIPHYSAQTCSWGTGKVSKKRYLTNNWSKPSGHEKFFAEVNEHTKQRTRNWRNNSAKAKASRLLCVEWDKTPIDMIKATNVPISRLYFLNRIDKSKPLEEGNWFWCQVKTIDFEQALNYSTVNKLPMIIDPTTHPDMFVYTTENLGHHTILQNWGSKQVPHLVEPDDFKARILAFVETYGIKSMGLDEVSQRMLEDWLNPAEGEIMNERNSETIARGNAVEAKKSETSPARSLTVAYFSEMLPRINSKCDNWIRRNIATVRIKDAMGLINEVGWPLSQYYSLRRIDLNKRLSFDNHQWVLSAECLQELGLPEVLSPSKTPEHYLVLPGCADRVFMGRDGYNNARVNPTVNLDSTLSEYVARHGAMSLGDVPRLMALVKTPKKHSDVVESTNHAEVTQALSEPRSEGPFMNRACTKAEATIIANRVSEEIFLNRCTLEEAIFKALNRVF